MPLRYALLNAALAVLVTLSCGGGDVVNGFGTYGSGRLQGFVSRPDGSPVADIDVFASFGPNAFGHGVKTDARGLYELEAVSHTPLDQPPFTDGVVQCRIGVGQGLTDTLVSVRFAATGQSPIPLTVNFVVEAP
jgi:hypothetical protein